MAKNTPAPAAPADTDAESELGKGHPTPSRKEREAARRRPLVAGDRAEQRRRMQSDREKQRTGYAAGDPKFLPAKDQGPQKKFARDYVDARFSVGEALIPVMVIIIALTFVKNNAVQQSSLLFLWLFFAGAVIDAIVAGQIATKRLRAKYGDKAERVRWYIAMRAFQLRPIRMPKSQVKRGAFPTL